jgi:hypothetical protein
MTSPATAVAAVDRAALEAKVKEPGRARVDPRAQGMTRR